MASRKPPRMTKAHFVFLADLLRRARTAVGEKADLADFDAAVTFEIANALGETNPDFDLVRFLRAVGIPV